MAWKDEKDLNRQLAIRKVLAFNAQSAPEFAWHASHALKLAKEKRNLNEQKKEGRQ